MSSRLSGKGFQHHQHPKVDDSDDNIFQIKLKQFEACTNLAQLAEVVLWLQKREKKLKTMWKVLPCM